jgi:predicted nuclease of predicted toxin-antitoxin system
MRSAGWPDRMSTPGGSNASSVRAGHLPRFLTDEGFDLDIVAGLRKRLPEIDILTAQDAGLLETPDPVLLAYAKEHDRILLTHDIHTMPVHFNDLLLRMPSSEHSPGVMWLAQRLPLSTAIAAVQLVWSCSSHDEWRDQFTYLPL